MKSSAYVTRARVALATVLLIFTGVARAQIAPTRAEAIATPRELNMLVLGDSILWGQGLKNQNKSWYLVKTWLEKTTGMTLHEKIEAHAGAMIGSAGAEVPKTLTVHGEINSAYPTLHDQIDEAIKGYVDPSQVDLVLVDGCINDVNARRFLNAANAPDEIQALAQEKCGAPVEQLLKRIALSFSNAHIIVSGYYPVISEKTPRDFFMRALAKRFYAQIDANAPKIRQRVLFAKVAFEPEHAFAAHDSRLWGFDASLLRKLLVILTLGRVTLTTNDEVRSQRWSVCGDFFKAVRGETDDQKRRRKETLMVCRLAAIAHPNRKGAMMYAEAIKEQVQAFLRSPGWLRMATVSAAGSQ